MAKILLMTTPRPSQGESPLHFGCGRPPQGLGYISIMLEQDGHKTKIVDLYTFGGEGISNDSTTIQNIGEQLYIDLDNIIGDFNPDYIGMHISTLTSINAYKLSAELAMKYPRITQVCGGPHVTLFPDSVPDTFAIAVTGAGEYAMRGIVNNHAITGRIRGKTFVVDGGCLTSDQLNLLPWPNYDEFINLPYNYTLTEFGIDGEALILNTSRGCPYQCKFCASKFVHPSYSCTQAYNVFSHMVHLSNHYNINNFYFREDNFTAIPRRVESFCNMIIASGEEFNWVCESRAKELTLGLIALMSKAGCKGLYIGCESGSNKVLGLMHKKESVEDYKRIFPVLKANGINTYTTWMYGFPGEMSEDREMTEKLIEELVPTNVDEFVFIGIPKSYMYVELDESGDYEFKDKYGFIYPWGYLSLAEQVYGVDDPKVVYVQNEYSKHNISRAEIVW